MGFVDLGLRIKSHSGHGIDGNLGLRTISSLRDPFHKSNGLRTCTWLRACVSMCEKVRLVEVSQDLTKVPLPINHILFWNLLCFDAINPFQILSLFERPKILHKNKRTKNIYFQY